MMSQQWQVLASTLATLWQGRIPLGRHGATFTDLEDGGRSVALVFGCDDYAKNKSAQRRVTVLWNRLHELSYEELALGLSPDRTTWVLVVKGDAGNYKTGLGQAFHQELQKADLDDAIGEMDMVPSKEPVWLSVHPLKISSESA